MATSKLDPANDSNNNSSTDEEVMQLLLQYHRRLFGYLRTILNNTNDAEEVLQNTCVTLWRKRHQFIAGTSFVNWSMTVAQNEVRRFRRDCKHVPQLLTEDLLEQIALEALSDADLIEVRFQALDQCIEKLNERDRYLVGMAYSSGAPTKKDISQRLGMTPNALCKILNRIRQRLLKCIEHRLTAEGLS